MYTANLILNKLHILHTLNNEQLTLNTMNTLNIAQWTLNTLHTQKTEHWTLETEHWKLNMDHTEHWTHWTLNTGKFPPTSHCTSLYIIFFFHAKYATAARECRLYSSSFAKFNMTSKKPPGTNIYDLIFFTNGCVLCPQAPGDFFGPLSSRLLSSVKDFHCKLWFLLVRLQCDLSSTVGDLV